MTSFLSEIGYVVHEAEHGEAALAMQKAVNPQLMIIDFAMPGTNGAEVVKAARAVQPTLADPVRQRLRGFRGARSRDGLGAVSAQAVPARRTGHRGAGGSRCGQLPQSVSRSA